MTSRREPRRDPFADEFFTNHAEWERKFNRGVKISMALYLVVVAFVAVMLMNAVTRCRPTIHRVGSKLERILDKAAR